MREYTVRVFDDLDYANDKKKTEAAATVTVGLNGTWRELDLSEKNHDEVTRLLGEWMAAGHVPDTQPKPGSGAPGSRKGTNLGKKIPSESREYGRGIRAFAKEHGLSYLTSTGKHYYSTALKRAYAEHLEAQAREAQQEGQ